MGAGERKASGTVWMSSWKSLSPPVVNVFQVFLFIVVSRYEGEVVLCFLLFGDCESNPTILMG